MEHPVHRQHTSPYLLSRQAPSDVAECANGNVSGDGGGISNSGTLTLNNSTFSGNTSGGSLVVASVGGAASFENTIIAVNTVADVGPDCEGALTSQGHNVVQDVASCAIDGDPTGNITGANPTVPFFLLDVLSL